MRSRLRIICVVFALLVVAAVHGQVPDGEHTFAIEVNGVVCGYADVRLSTVDGEQGPETLFEQKTFMMLSALGSEFNTRVDVTCRIDPDTGDFRVMRTHVEQAEVVVDFDIEIEGRTARCRSSLLGEETLVELPDDVIIGNPIYSRHLLGDFATGAVTEMTRSSFNAREFLVDEVTFTWGGRETLELAGRTFETFIVDILSRSSGVKVRAWLDAGTGMIVRTKDPRGQTACLADPSVKKRIELVNVDENILVRTNVSIPDIQRISYMKVQAVLEPTGSWLTPEDLNVPGQRFVGTVTDNLVEGVFEVEHPHFDGTGAPRFPEPTFDDESLRAYLEPSEFIESDDAVLIEKARGLTGGSADSWEAAVRLSRWVADEIAYEIPGGGTARRTYDLRAGECGSHSILLAAFCRGVGIPARVVWGCMYSPNFGGAFGQHAWTEVYMGEAGWIPVDSTAHENGFVDSGHIRLGELTSHSIALNAKSMEVLDYRVDAPAVNASADAGDGESPYAPYLGQYDPPGGGGAPFTVQAAEGRLAVNIPGRMVLTFNDPDEDGRWLCTMTNNLFVTFDREGDDPPTAFSIHERVRMRRLAAPEAIGTDVPVALREYLGDYRFPGRPEPFSVTCDGDRLTVRYQGRPDPVHLDPTGEEECWIDEFGGNSLMFERDGDGRIKGSILEVVSTFRRRTPPAESEADDG